MSLQPPKTVVLRKTWVLMAAILLILIIALILYNLYRASHQSFHSSEKSKIQILSTATNTRWYQQQSVADTPKLSVSLPVQVVKQQDEFSEDDLKAMSEPISSHQLKASISAVTKAVDNATEKSNPDQNGQSEKKAFIQIKPADNTSASDYLASRLQTLVTPYELQAGSIIPGVMITGIDTDLPGQIIAQVRSNVYDSSTGKYLLIPQGSRLTGQYDSQITYGQRRILIIWKRIIFPNGESINLQGMPGMDRQGYAGFKGNVNNHYLRIFGSAILMTIIGTGAQLAAPTPDNVLTPLTVKQALAQSLNSNLTNMSASITAKNLNIQPTLEVQPGYEFTISVTKDMIFPWAYHA